MKKKNVFIVASHVRKIVDRLSDQWEVHEKVEFVDQLSNKHIQNATSIVDFMNEKVVKGQSIGVEYEEFIDYVRNKYPKEMDNLQELFKPTVVEEVKSELVDLT
jgi:hypothetical protein